MPAFLEDTLRDLLPLYYKRLFPYDLFYRWLSYGKVPANYFHNREFSFTLTDDIYIRYQSFMDQREMEDAIRLKNPYKIDIGAVYSFKPKDHRKVQSMVPLEKELVFDIDMTDYDEVRTCCQGADICSKCWRFMAIACKVLDIALRDDFGFEHLLWVFSGRRGIHCWVCDSTARKLDVEVRSTIADYLMVVQGGDDQAKKVKLDGEKMHFSIKRAHKIIKEQFVTMCVEEQDMLGTPKQIAEVFALFPEEACMESLKEQMKRLETSRERWDAIVQHLTVLQEKDQLKKWRQFLIEEVMLQYAYPRLDINVSKGINHLLKSPFCIHPKTGKVCTPFNPKLVDKFNPNAVPTITQLVNEIKEFDEKESAIDEKEMKSELNSSEVGADMDTSASDLEVKKVCKNVKKLKDYKKTSMYKSILVFEEFVRKLEESQAVKSDTDSNNMEF